MKSKLLIVVDMQNDFIDGALGTDEAKAIVPNAVKKIESWDGDVLLTYDTHDGDYLQSNEGKHLPVVHCVENTYGHKYNNQIMSAINERAEEHGTRVYTVYKPTFGSTALPGVIRGKNYKSIEIIGLCTDICVVSNALILKANYPETEIVVDASCCAGVTPETHNAALATMKMCQIKIVEE